MFLWIQWQNKCMEFHDFLMHSVSKLIQILKLMNSVAKSMHQMLNSFVHSVVKWMHVILNIFMHSVAKLMHEIFCIVYAFSVRTNAWYFVYFYVFNRKMYAWNVEYFCAFSIMSLVLCVEADHTFNGWVWRLCASGASSCRIQGEGAAGFGESHRCDNTGGHQHLPAVACLPSALRQTHPQLSTCEETQ